MAGGLSQVRGDALVPYAWPELSRAAAGRERHCRLSRVDVGQHRRHGLAHSRRHGSALRSAQRPSQRQGLCDSGRRARHVVDDVEQGPARRQDRRPRRVCRRPSRGRCRRGCSGRPTGWSARSACWRVRAPRGWPTARCGSRRPPASCASTRRTCSTTRCRRRSSSKAITANGRVMAANSEIDGPAGPRRPRSPLHRAELRQRQRGALQVQARRVRQGLARRRSAARGVLHEPSSGELFVQGDRRQQRRRLERGRRVGRVPAAAALSTRPRWFLGLALRRRPRHARSPPTSCRSGARVIVSASSFGWSRSGRAISSRK